MCKVFEVVVDKTCSHMNTVAAARLQISLSLFPAAKLIDVNEFYTWNTVILFANGCMLKLIF